MTKIIKIHKDQDNPIPLDDSDAESFAETLIKMLQDDPDLNKPENPSK